MCCRSCSWQVSGCGLPCVDLIGRGAGCAAGAAAAGESACGGCFLFASGQSVQHRNKVRLWRGYELT